MGTEHEQYSVHCTVIQLTKRNMSAQRHTQYTLHRYCELYRGYRHIMLYISLFIFFLKNESLFRFPFQGTVSRDFLWLQMDRTWVSDVPLKVDFLRFHIQNFKFKVFSRLSFYCCTQTKLSVRPGTLLLPGADYAPQIIFKTVRQSWRQDNAS